MTQYVRLRAAAEPLGVQDPSTLLTWARAGLFPGVVEVRGVTVVNVDIASEFWASRTSGVAPEDRPALVRSIAAAMLRAAKRQGTAPRPRRS